MSLGFRLVKKNVVMKYQSHVIQLRYQPLNCHSLRHMGQWAWEVCEFTHFRMQWRWKAWLHAPQTAFKEKQNKGVITIMFKEKCPSLMVFRALLICVCITLNNTNQLWVAMVDSRRKSLRIWRQCKLTHSMGNHLQGACNQGNNHQRPSYKFHMFHLGHSKSMMQQHATYILQKGG